MPDLSRRQFLQSAGALPFLASASPAHAATPPHAETPFVELAVATICTDGFGNQHHEPAFRLLPQLGVKNVEFNVWYPDVITPNYVAGIKRRCAETGLKPVCLQGSSFGGEGSRGVLKDVGHKLALMYGARELGCRRIKCTGAARGTEGGLKSVIEVLRELAPAAKELDMLVLVENHAKNVLENIADYEEIFAAIDSPHIGMCLDTCHFEAVNVSLHDVVEKFHSRILHVDLKDAAERGNGHKPVPYGDGVTDFKAFMEHLRAKHYRGYLLLELAYAQPREPVLENLRKGRDFFAPYARL